MSKFTKGKWHIKEDRFIVDDKDFSIAYVLARDSEEETVANLQLIANAPKMYYLLKSLEGIDFLKHYVAYEEFSPEKRMVKPCKNKINAIDDIKELLASIEGEESNAKN